MHVTHIITYPLPDSLLGYIRFRIRLIGGEVKGEVIININT
jgi:hypothetical protein